MGLLRWPYIAIAVAGSPNIGARPMGCKCPSAAGGVVHGISRIGGGAAAGANTTGGGHAALGPAAHDFDLVTAAGEFVPGGLGHPTFDHERPQSGAARPEARDQVVGVPGRRVDRLLQVHTAVDATEQELCR